MKEEEYNSFTRWSIESYANELLTGKSALSLEEAIKRSEDEFHEMLPEGLTSKDCYLYTIENEKNENIGVIFYQRHLFKPELAFIGEFIIKPEYRRYGYGEATLYKVFKDAKEKGFERMELNVFKHNIAACTLYKKTGWEVVVDYEDSIIMGRNL